MEVSFTLFERLESTLAWQFLTHSANGFARFVTWVSFLGLALGVMILTLVVTVMNGFDHELKTRLLSSLPHVTVSREEARPALQAAAAQDPAVVSATDYFQGLGAVVAQSRVFPLTLLGVGADSGQGLFTAQMGAALTELQANPNGIVVGEPLARALGADIGDSMTLIAAEVDDNAVRPVVLSFVLVGTFNLGAEPDYNLAVINLQRFAAEQWGVMGELGYRLQLRDPLQAEAVISRLSSAFPDITFTSWQSQYGELFRAVQLEKSMMFVLLFLVVAIAAFNIIAGQSMLVNDKRRSIAILLTMGCNQQTIRRVFLLQGAMISVVGTALGIALGVWAAHYVNEILSFTEQISGMHLLDGSLFVEVPILVMYGDLVFIALVSLGLCALASWVPAAKASAIDPVTALH